MIVVDASVMVKWVVPEPQSDQARALQVTRMFAPDICFVECANAFWRIALRGEIRVEEAARLLKVVEGLRVETTPAPQLAATALTLAVELKHPIYDCLYLALAVERECEVVTADARFHKAVAGSPHADRVRLLGA